MNPAVVIAIAFGALAIGLTGWVRHLIWQRRFRRELKHLSNNPRRDLP